MAGNGVAVKQQRALAEFRDEWLECRDGSHAWSRSRYSFEERDKVVRRERHCERCSAQQVALILRTTGEYLVRPRIVYPEGYTLKGTGRIAKVTVRKESVRRVYVDMVKRRRDDPAVHSGELGRTRKGA